MTLQRWPNWVIPANWPAPSTVHAVTTCRHGPGVSVAPFDRLNLGWSAGDDPAHVAVNRSRMQAALRLPSAPCWLHQVHGTDVVRITHAPLSGLPRADAAVTRCGGRVLAVVTADCLPIVLADREGTHVAIAHAGWRGLAANVVERTIQTLGLPPCQLLAWLGPAASVTAYEVGQDVHAACCTADPACAQAFSASRPGHWFVDLYALAALRLRQAGLAQSAVFCQRLCTISDPDRFFSYRRDGRTGRMATLVWSEPTGDNPSCPPV